MLQDIEPSLKTVLKETIGSNWDRAKTNGKIFIFYNDKTNCSMTYSSKEIERLIEK